jgi:poly(beta-D-mannuronate) lyase
MSASIALNDRDLFEFAMAKYKEAVDQIQNDGTLPQELARGSQALHYHNWVLTPLSIIATFAEANGVDLWTYKNKRINLLTQLLVPTLGSPDEFKKINGITPDREFIGSDSAWTELIYRRDHDLKIKAYLEKSRPIEEYWFDWDMTASFGEI